MKHWVTTTKLCISYIWSISRERQFREKIKYKTKYNLAWSNKLLLLFLTDSIVMILLSLYLILLLLLLFPKIGKATEDVTCWISNLWSQMQVDVFLFRFHSSRTLVKLKVDMNEKIKIASIELGSEANNAANIMMADEQEIFYEIVPTIVIVVLSKRRTKRHWKYSIRN